MKTYLMDVKMISRTGAEDEYTTIKIIRKGVAKENRGDWLNDHCFNVWVGDHMVKCGMLNATWPRRVWHMVLRQHIIAINRNGNCTNMS